MNLLFFSVEGIRCAIPTGNVRNVLRMVRLSPATDPAENIAGTINFHGATIPVISVRSIFGLPERKPCQNDILIVAFTGEKSIALWADEIGSVKETAGAAGAKEIVAGLHISDQGVVIIDDIQSFIGDTHPGRLREAIARSMPGREAGTGVSWRPLPDMGMDMEKVDEILSRRATELAEPALTAEKGEPIEILTFRLRYQEYAIQMEYIREVMIHNEITPVPGTPEFITGICAVRGEIISLVDLRVLFDLPEKGLTDLNRVIVLSDGSITFGILADYITDIGTITQDQIKTIPSEGRNSLLKYQMGMVRDSIIMLDAAKILADPAMVVDET